MTAQIPTQPSTSELAGGPGARRRALSGHRRHLACDLGGRFTPRA